MKLKKQALSYFIMKFTFILVAFSISLSGRANVSKDHKVTEPIKRYLYVAVPGVRNYLGFGGHGLLIFDISKNHQFVKRIPLRGLSKNGKPSNVKGIAVSLATNSVYVSTLEALQRIDLTTNKIIWEKYYEGGCDRMSMSKDGKQIYQPSLEGEFWNIIDAETGDVIKKVNTNPGAHNTVTSLDGSHVYLAGLRTKTLGVLDTHNNTVVKQVGPFTEPIRPFTVNGKSTLCYVCINGLLGFEVGDLVTGKRLYGVEVEGFTSGPVKRHGCPSHGIGLTPDEKEIWLCDGANNRIHVFDNTVTPAKQVTSIELRDMPGWVTFSMDGKYAYPSTGDVIDVKTRKIIATLEDEHNNAVQSEKMVEVDFAGNKAIKAGDQFGVGRAAAGSVK